MGDQCLSLSGSTACGALSGYTAYIEGQLGITDVASFDTYVENGVAVNGSFGGVFTTTFGCAGWTGAGLRYHQSALCAAFVGNAFVSGATGNATTCTAAARAPIPMCASVLAAFVASYRALLANASVCPDPSSTASAYLDFFEAAAPFLSTADNCLLGLAEDRAQCGFMTSAEDRVYCASSNGTVDPCCSLLTVPSQISTPQTQTTTTTTTALSSNTTASTPASAYTIPITVIVSAAGSAVFLLACVVLCICIKTAKRFRARKSDLDGEDDENTTAVATESSGYTAKKTKKKAIAVVAKKTAKNIRVSAATVDDGSVDPPSVNESIRGENAAGKRPTAHAVVHRYYAEKTDELNAAVGDTFLVKEQYDDGWGYGYNTRTHEEGFFPLGILSGFTIPSGRTPSTTTAETSSVNSLSMNRTSSLGRAPTTIIETVPAVPRVPTNILEQQYQYQVQHQLQQQYHYQSEYTGSNTQRSPPIYGPKSPLPIIPASSASPLAPQPATMRMSVEFNPTPVRSNRIAKMQIVMYGFEPGRRDEIELRVGDQVQVLQEFDDGWGVGRNLNTGLEGVLPLDCLNGYASLEQQQQVMSCISLVGSTSCPSFAGYTGYLSFNATSVTEFDAYVEQSVTTDTGDAGTFASSMVTTLGCTGWAGTGLRYHRTAVCGLLVYYAGQYGAGSGAPCNASQAAVGADPLCAATMNSFLASWAAVTASNASCPDGGDAANLQAYISGYDAALSLLQDAVGCVASVPQDTANCGFTDAADAVAFCAATPTATCCNTQSTTTSSATSSYSATQAATTTTSIQSLTTSSATSVVNSDTSVSITTIAGAAGGAFVLLVIIIVTICCVRRKSRAHVSDSYAFTKKPPLPSSTSAASSYAAGGSHLKQQKSHRVVYDYIAQHPDEINCAIGDQIVLKTEYDDGWAFGLNTITKQEGYFPIEILQEFAQPLQNKDHKSNDYSQRSSSLYGGKNIYDDNNNNTNSIYLTPSAAAASIHDYNSPNSKYQSTYTYATNNSVYDPIVEPLEVAKIGTDEAVYAFDAERKDEVSLRPGDRVLVSKSFDDGWCYGTVLATQRTGYFPYDCLASYEREHAATNNTSNTTAKKGKKARVSSIYDSESIYDAPQQQQPNVAADGSILVVYEFVPQNGDEVALRVGDRVLLKHEYDDGWAYGFNTSTKKEGILPLDCLASRDETSSTARRRGGQDRISTRISSLYGGEANTDSYYPQSNYGTDSVYY
ncbi:Sorbin and SH3 domain-containing protein 1 [Physocladia obscura]|uniref:Sorbin and SH3 domain-containing protein 1 n=1 Tax=Physocladia obscura TaxID=109957 RepID=A0AAD5XHQ2_9FUNG|nr:Sorbin and SH3 domain-containing protein 1 [Physocladia obscura]